MGKIKILYEDNHVVVVVKPVGVPVQRDESCDKDMLTMVKEYIKETYNKPGNVYVGLVHRLDRMVGGVMVFAKTSKAASRLSECIRKKNMNKKYFAIVNGNIKKGESAFLQNYLLKDEKLNMSKVVAQDAKGAKLSSLEYSVLNNFKYIEHEYTLLDVVLISGRHHQIRVQLANIGYPLYGDIKYGQNKNKVGQNLGLWSYYLGFIHPTKDEYLEFKFSPFDITKKDNILVDKIWSVSR
ncbi:MAG: RNA pseudouridine synthase [Clostridia bacterium]